MRIFQRISDIMSANLNELIDRYEDPEAMLKQAVREMEAALAESLDSAVKAVANEKLLGREVERHRNQSNVWRERAEQSVIACDDEKARRALARKLQHDQLQGAVQAEHASHVLVCGKLRRQIDNMQIKLAEAQRKLTSLMARKRVAEAERKLRSVSSFASGLATSTKFDRMLRRMETAEAEVEAFEELNRELEDQEFCDETAAVERELVALKVALSVS